MVTEEGPISGRWY